VTAYVWVTLPPAGTVANRAPLGPPDGEAPNRGAPVATAAALIAANDTSLSSTPRAGAVPALKTSSLTVTSDPTTGYTSDTDCARCAQGKEGCQCRSVHLGGDRARIGGCVGKCLSQ
jgi:hypothetical protein